MKLAVSPWYPYQHQATALEQLASGIQFERVELDTLDSPFIDGELGPYLAVVDDKADFPLVHIPAIVEAFARAYPEKGYLPADPYERASVRGLSAKIEECFTRLTIAEIDKHDTFNRPKWNKLSEAPERMLDDLPKRLEVLERFQDGSTSRYLVGGTPTVADCLLAAMWWVMEDMDILGHLDQCPNLKAWNERACNGEPFKRNAA